MSRAYPPEIDGLIHGHNGVVRDSFIADVDRLSSEPRWATKWQHSSVRSMLCRRADTMFWLDLPSSVALGQVVKRTVGQDYTREELWKSNFEPGYGTR